MGVYIIGKKYNPDDTMSILCAGTDNVIYYECDLYQKILTFSKQMQCKVNTYHSLIKFTCTKKKLGIDLP